MNNVLAVPVTTTQHFTRSELSDLLAAAFEGGIFNTVTRIINTPAE